MENFQTVRGVKDLLPEELGKMRFIEQQAALVCKMLVMKKSQFQYLNLQNFLKNHLVRQATL